MRVAQCVVGQVEHMVRLEVRQVELEQREPLIDLLCQVESLNQLMHQADAAIGGTCGPLRQLEVQVRAADHRAAHVIGEIEPIQPLLDAPLARPHSICDTVAHSKSSVLLWRVCCRLQQIPRKTPEVFEIFSTPWDRSLKEGQFRSCK